ncbi:MAG: Nif3-like dinuclear metal center hexameric protein [Coriobacteriaceae bacterium]|nr:Nif3-like dinuclear metal center hexameric protein [Coriobacteriaceae bacterium]
MKIAELEKALFLRFPREDAEDWDNVGLSCGRPGAEVAAIACALDASLPAIEAAAEAGANVLLTHHPIHLSAPDAVVDAGRSHPASSPALFRAIEAGVSVISLHTNLDRSREARAILPQLMGLEARSSLEFPADPAKPGLGAVANAEGMTLGRLAARAAAAFGGAPRVWGGPDSEIRRVAFLGGSLGHLGDALVGAGAEAVVTGEAGYHVCQDLLLRGVGAILLGHDRSERPFVNILQEAAAQICPAARIVTIDGPQQWWTQPEIEEGGRS